MGRKEAEKFGAQDRGSEGSAVLYTKIEALAKRLQLDLFEEASSEVKGAGKEVVDL